MNIVAWINKNEVKYINDDDENFLYDCSRILDAVTFYKKPVILYEKGKEIVYLDRSQLVEITKSYSPIPQKVDTSASKEVISLNEKRTIIYNGQEIDYVKSLEVGELIFSYLNARVKDKIISDWKSRDQHNSMYLREDNIYFLISKNLKSIMLMPWFYPYSGHWNGYSLFKEIETIEIKSLKELSNING